MRMKWLYGGQCQFHVRKDVPALVCGGVHYRYNPTAEDVLVDVNLTVSPGERVAMVGPNGAGKTTLINLILGIETLKRGCIDVYGIRASECLHRVAAIPQRNKVDWNFPVSVRDVVMMGRYVHRGWFRSPRTEDYEAVESAMEAMEISDLAECQVGELSGGQQQRIMLARALAHQSDLLLMDEPLNHVDFSTRTLIFKTLEKLADEGKAIIVSTHDVGVLSLHFTRAVFMDRTIIADGSVESVLTPGNISRAYD